MMNRIYPILLTATLLAGCSKNPETVLPAADAAVRPRATILTQTGSTSFGGENARSAIPANTDGGENARSAIPANTDGGENARSAIPANTADPQGGTTSENSSAPGTRAAVLDTKFPASTADVFRMTAYTGVGTPSDFSTPWFADQSVDTDSSSNPIPATPRYYPADGTKLSFYAWAPGITPSTGTADEAPQAAYTLSGQEDILWAADASGIGRHKPQGQPSFTFRHLLKRITFRMTAGTGFPDGVNNVTSIKITGAKTSARLNTVTGALTFDAAPTADLTAYADATGLAIAAAGTDIPGSVMFEPGETFSVGVTAGGVEYNELPITLSGTDAGLAGKSHRVTLTFKGTELVVSAVERQDWIDADGGTVDVVESPKLEVDQNGILTVNGKMVFSKFGSVVCFTQEGAWGADKVLFNPVTGSPSYTDYLAIPVYEAADFAAGYKNISADTYHTGANVKAGKGDPCRLVGLSAAQIQSMTDAEIDAYNSGNSGWRLPTSEDQKTFTGQTAVAGYSAHWTASDFRYDGLYYSTGSVGGYFPKDEESKKKNYLPAAGLRSMNGNSGLVGTHGHYWSSEASENTSGYGHGLLFGSSTVNPLCGNPYATGYGVRCVREPGPLKVDQNGILTVDGKILFFKFGSVVGFTQEGVWRADRVLFNPVTGSPDYAVYAEIPVYETTDYRVSANVSDPLYHKGTNVKAGKGDPCKLAGLTAARIQSMTAEQIDAHNSGWRLPTNAENLSFTGQTTNGPYAAHWTGEDLRYHKWYNSLGSAGGYFPKGEESDKKNFIPAAGWRNINGSFSTINSDASYWSSEAQSDRPYAYYLYFWREEVNPSSYETPRLGFSVRCVEAEVLPEVSTVLMVDSGGKLNVDGEGKMLFFKFGGVVGFTQEGAWSADKVLFDPVTSSHDYTAYRNIPVYTSADWKDEHKNVSDTAYHNGTNVKAGRGDPCKLVGLTAARIQSMTDTEIDAYISGWRLATKEDQCDFTGQTANVTYTTHWIDEDLRYDKWYYSTGSAGGYFPMGEESDTKNYLPAAGGRDRFGNTFKVRQIGYYWSSKAETNSLGQYMYFENSTVFPVASNGYAGGFGARCVRR